MRALFLCMLVWVSLHSQLCAAHPNILFIMADDLRPQLGCYGDKVVKTPHLDQFAKSSLVFNNAYVQCAICSPTRNSLLSGLRPHTTGLRGFGTTLREVVPDVITLPQHFKNNGYYSAAFGKIFHVYAESILGSEDDPLSWSQPLYLPILPVWGPEQAALRNKLIAEQIAQGQEFVHPHDYAYARIWDAPDVLDHELQDGEIVNRATQFLKKFQQEQPAKPFFLAVGFLKPHLPNVAPQKYFDLYDHTKLELPDNRFHPRDAPQFTINHGIGKKYYGNPSPTEINDDWLKQYLRSYYACISYVDACAGKLFQTLDELKLRDNTIILFLGDHGYQMGEHDSWGAKHSNYEISTRAPLLISAPGMKSMGHSTTSLVEFLDIYPTLVDLAELPVPKHLEGKSLKPILNDPQQSLHDEIFSEMNRGKFYGRTIRNNSFRYVEWTDSTHKLIARELYDLKTDPQENQNLAKTPSLNPQMKALSQTLNTKLPLQK